MQTTRIGRTYRSSQYSTNPSDTAIIAHIVDEFVNQHRQNIDTWRKGIEAATHPTQPRWYILQDLFEYLSTDGHYSSCTTIRKGAVLGKPFMIRDSSTGQEDPDKTKMLQKAWFFRLLNDLLEGIFKAATVAQIPDYAALLNPNPLVHPYTCIPRRNFIPQLNMVAWQAAVGDQGVSLLDPAFKNTIVCYKGMEPLGLMNKIVPDLIWKKNARQAWAEFGTKFGIPLVKIETNKTNKADLDKLETMAKMMGKAARAILPTGSKMEIIDSATKGDPHKIFLEQVNLGNDEISKAILCGTMIVGDGSSRSQSEVHERNLDDKVTKMDLRDMEFTINDQLLPIMIAAGFPLTDKDEFVFDLSQTLTLDQHWKMVSDAIGRGYEMDEQWLMETFPLKITGKKEPAPPPIIPGNQPKGFFA